MYVNDLNVFKEIYFQYEMISKLERDIFRLNIALEPLKDEHASLVNENLCIYNTLEENVDIFE